VTIQAVLFDLDGVLCDCGPYHFAALNTALSAHGYTPIALDEHKHEFDGLPTTIKLARLAEAGRVRTEDFDSIRAIKQKETARLIGEKAKFDPTIFCLLAGLHQHHIGVGIVSNAIADTIWKVLDRLGVRYFVNIVNSNEEAPPKPSPALYELAARRFDLKPSDCLAVEDGHYGIESATRAGCKVLKVSGPADVTPANIWKAMEGQS
jgi:HAD superfamily hydrolase (TIGR01509 family)